MADEANDPQLMDSDNTLLTKILRRLRTVFESIMGGGGGPITVTLEASDIEIGAVEIKDSSTNNRVRVIDTCPASNDEGLVTRNIPCGTQDVNIASTAVAVPVTDNGGSLTIDTPQLPAALVGGQLDTNVGAWLGSTAPTVGQKTMANSVPVVLPSDQTIATTLGAGDVEDAGNSSTTPLGAGGVFTGATKDSFGYSEIGISLVVSNLSPGTDILSVLFSQDGITYAGGNMTVNFSVSPPSPVQRTAFTIYPLARYYKITYISFGGAQLGFSLKTVLKVLPTGARRGGAGGGPEINAVLVTVANDSSGILSVDDNGSSLTVDNPILSIVGGGTEAAAQRVTIANDSTGVLSVDDNGASLTVDNPILSVVGGGTEAAAQRVTIANDSTGVLSVDDNGASLTVDNPALSVVGGGTEAAALRVTVATDSTGVLSVDDNGASLTVDNATLAVVGGGTEATALRVTIATDSTGVLSVDDNGASLTVDNSTLAVVGGGTEAAAMRVTIANDSTGVLSVDDNGGSLTVDGTVVANQGTAASDIRANAWPVACVPRAGTAENIYVATAVAMAKGASRNYLSVYNADAALKVDILFATITQEDTAAVTGLLRGYRLFRFTTVHSGGTSLTPIQLNTSMGALDADVTARSNNETIGGAETMALAVCNLAEEETAGSPRQILFSHLETGFCITLNTNEGVVIQQDATAGVGTISAAIYFRVR